MSWTALLVIFRWTRPRNARALLVHSLQEAGASDPGFGLHGDQPGFGWLTTTTATHVHFYSIHVYPFWIVRFTKLPAYESSASQ